MEWEGKGEGVGTESHHCVECRLLQRGGLLSFARSVPYIVARGTGWKEEQTADG